MVLEELFLTDPFIGVDDTKYELSEAKLIQAGLNCPTGWANKGYQCGMSALYYYFNQHVYLDVYMFTVGPGH